jgi:cellulose synthase/poly-beta-1,6-N-acetylglucosamine synthase-like glycosyltransferase
MARCVFAISIALILYAYAGYPLLCWIRARLRARPVRRAPFRPRVSVLIAAWREAGSIGRKLRSLAAQGYPAELVEVIVVCDGSDDGTPRLALVACPELALSRGERLRVIALPVHGGKAQALNHAAALARGEVLVLTDARQPLAPDALERLVDNLADPEVGVVGGLLELVDETQAGLYWRYEATLRRWEAAAGSTVGVSGALYAMRRELFHPLPSDTVLDDVLVPMRARLAGWRVALEPAARAFDHGAPLGREFARKVRTLSGNLQLLLLEPRLLSPWANPSWFAFVSHKLVRLLVPYAMIAALVSSLTMHTLAGALLFGAQLSAYGMALLAWLGHGRGSRLARLCETVVVLNAAAVVGLLRFARHGRRLEWQ